MTKTFDEKMKFVWVRLILSDWVHKEIQADKIEEWLKENPNWEISPD